MEVSSCGDLALYIIMNAPMYLALAVLTWKLSAKLQWFDNAFAYLIYSVLLLLYCCQVWKIIQVNKSIFKTTVPEIHRYSFRQVAILDLAYLLTFGTELAVVSMLPLFYVDTFGVEPVKAGILAGIYPVINLFARPGGGWLSDKIGRKITLAIVTFGIAGSFLGLGYVTSDWPLWLVVLATIIGGIFSKAGSGAVYAMVPLIQRRMTGQIAGMAGAYGNVGGVVFLTVLSFLTPAYFFTFISATAAVVFLAIILLLKEPKGQMAEIMPDGTVQMIDIK